MPILNGVDTSKFIKSNGNNVPIITLTENVLEGDEERFLEAGINKHSSLSFIRT